MSKTEKLYRMRDIIAETGIHRRRVMNYIDIMMLTPARRDADGTRYFRRDQVDMIIERAKKGKSNDWET